MSEWREPWSKREGGLEISNLKSGPSCSPRCCPSLPTLPSPRLAPFLRQRRRLAQIGLGLRAWSEHHSLLMPSPLVSQSGGSRVVCLQLTVAPSAHSLGRSEQHTCLQGPFRLELGPIPRPKEGIASLWWSANSASASMPSSIRWPPYEGSYTAGGHQSVGSSFVCHV